MDYETLRIERNGPATVIRLHRPEKRHAITFRMMDELEAALASLRDDAATRGIVLTGDDACFSAGMDLNAMKGVISPGDFIDYMNRWRGLNLALEEHKKPIVAAIEGFCLTGGFELALACDLRIGAAGSSYGITSSKIGTVPGAGGTQRLPRIVGIANALDLLFSAEAIDAERAFRIGILNRLVPKGGALAAALQLVGIYAERAPLSLQFAKRAVYGGMQMPLDDAIKFEGFVVSTIYQSRDKQEGITAFLEKRPARFEGR
jgi:enoyl-CoA hydratase/carnithine racemase